MALINDVIERLDDLPALPESLVKMRTMLANSDFNIKELTEVVKKDEALAAVVLRSANSAFYNTGGATFDLNQSLVRLGSKELIRLVTRSSMHAVFENAGQSYGLRRGNLSLSAAGGAAVARTLASESGSVDPELAYTCSLLRDVGKLVIDHYMSSQKLPAHAPEDSKDGEQAYLDTERERFGFDHTEAGFELIKRWRLPDPIAGAVGFHHAPPVPDSDEHSDLFDIVHASDIVVLWAGLGIGDDGLAYRIVPHVQDGLLNNRARNEQLVAEAWDASAEFDREQNETDDRLREVPA